MTDNPYKIPKSTEDAQRQGWRDKLLYDQAMARVMKRYGITGTGLGVFQSAYLEASHNSSESAVFQRNFDTYAPVSYAVAILGFALLAAGSKWESNINQRAKESGYDDLNNNYNTGFLRPTAAFSGIWLLTGELIKYFTWSDGAQSHAPALLVTSALATALSIAMEIRNFREYTAQHNSL